MCVKERPEKLFTSGNKEPLKMARSFTTDIQVGNNILNTEFIIIEGWGQALLGRDKATQLGVLKITDPTSYIVNTVRQKDTCDKLFKTYEKCF